MALAEAGWPNARVNVESGDVGVFYEPGMPKGLIRSAHAIAHGVHSRDYLPCEWCYDEGYEACADGYCQAPKKNLGLGVDDL